MVGTRVDELVWLRNQLEVEGNDLLREVVGSFAQGLMSAEVDGSVELGGVSGARIGYRTRRWDTRVGSIELRIPEAGEGFVLP